MDYNSNFIAIARKMVCYLSVERRSLASIFVCFQFSVRIVVLITLF